MKDTLRGFLITFEVVGLLALSLFIASLIVDVYLGYPPLYAAIMFFGNSGKGVTFDPTSIIWIIPAMGFVSFVVVLGLLSSDSGSGSYSGSRSHNEWRTNGESNSNGFNNPGPYSSTPDYVSRYFERQQENIIRDQEFNRNQELINRQQQE